MKEEKVQNKGAASVEPQWRPPVAFIVSGAFLEVKKFSGVVKEEKVQKRAWPPTSVSGDALNVSIVSGFFVKNNRFANFWNYYKSFYGRSHPKLSFQHCNAFLVWETCSVQVKNYTLRLLGGCADIVFYGAATVAFWAFDFPLKVAHANVGCMGAFLSIWRQYYNIFAQVFGKIVNGCQFVLFWQRSNFFGYFSGFHSNSFYTWGEECKA
jgi:hypothetical protein